jgi:hypothetical protein
VEEFEIMKSMIQKILSGFALLWLSVSFVLAQDTCPELVAQALTAADQACVDLNRNEACYGNVLLSAGLRADASSVVFEQTGDIAPLSDIETLSLTGLNVTDQTWGVALLKVQANLPDTLPGQNVTMVLFGDVQITDNSAGSLLTISASNNVNIRMTPSADAELRGSFNAGSTLIADGRLVDGSWVRVQLADGGIGWVRTDLVSVDGDLNTLPARAGDDTSLTPVYGPMQAFTFTTGIGDAACEEAPDGILVQTPEGQGKITLNMNGAEVELGSTAYLRADSELGLAVSVIEGEGRITSAGESKPIPAGSWVQVPLGENQQVDGPPSDPKPYDENQTLIQLPIALLPEGFEVAPSLTEEEIATFLAAAPTELAIGPWRGNFGSITDNGGCEVSAAEISAAIGGQPIDFAVSSSDVEAFFASLSGASEGDNPFMIDGTNATLTNVGPGLYELSVVLDDGEILNFTVTVVSGRQVDVAYSVSPEAGCTYTITAQYNFAG